MQTETWKEIWTRKGRAEGDLKDLLAYDGYEATQIDMEAVADRITQEMEIRPGDRVLEVGCGAGALAQYLDCQYVGVDYSETLARRHIELLGHSVLVGEADDLIFKDRSFDKVICYGVFLYFDHKEYAWRAVSELTRVARERVLIGELPVRSHREEHLLFSPQEFDGWKITEGFYDPYRKDRFNAMLTL